MQKPCRKFYSPLDPYRKPDHAETNYNILEGQGLLNGSVM